MSRRRGSETVVDLFDSIELDCTKWTDEERIAFREAVGLPASGAVAGLIADLMSEVGIEGSGPEGTKVALNLPTVRALCWIARRRRNPALTLVEVEVKDMDAVSAAIEKQIGGVVESALYGCGRELRAFCLAALLANACDNART